MQSKVLEKLLGKKVVVWSKHNENARDVGILSSFDEQWIVVDRENEQLYFPIAQIHCMKPMEFGG
ncbi:MAG: hypothetical protein MUC92_02990 [Fimbriimonadaceae bacterium]|jgi:small nuclear ribonucleoprotein (snRNP)-like protein|nr:hypothetical protein [Fimbriimonadaceae bacterium]